MRLFVCLFLFYSNCVGQSPIIISNIFQGEVIGLGFGHGGNGQPDTIKKTYPFDCTQCVGSINTTIVASELLSGDPLPSLNPVTIYINEIPVIFSNETRLGFPKYIAPQNAFYEHLTTSILPNTFNTIEFVIPPQPLNKAVSSFYLIMECKKTTSLLASYIVLVNNISSSGSISIPIGNQVETNPINNTYNVGFAHAGHTLNFLNGDAQIITFNGSTLGIIGGPDQISEEFFSSGTNGHFQYSEGLLLGLDDDNSDLSMDSTDALSNVQSLVLNPNSFYFESNPENAENITNFTQAIVLAYTSNCSSFPVSVSDNNPTICPNEPLQLEANGGIAYEWLPSTGLSCNTCFNPIFTGDSSQLYTVRIWSNDSCSVVRPVMVHVYPKPKFEQIILIPSVCGGATGTITVIGSNSTDEFALNSGAFQPSGIFSGLGAGNYTITLKDTNGCVLDSLVVIGDTLTVISQFTANPITGAVPLKVQITNQSTNSTNYEWFLNTIPQGNVFDYFTADSSGSYLVQLIAYQNNPSCADTSYITITAYDSLIVSIPNVFTPNHDGINDFFGITTTIPIEISYSIINRWGNVMLEGKLTSKKLVLTELWDGVDVSEGVYFYTISYFYKNKTTLLKGFLQLE